MENVLERYKLSKDYVQETLSRQEPENVNIYEIMQEIGRKRGCIVSGGKIDDSKTSKVIIDDFRSGKIGKITVEKTERM